MQTRSKKPRTGPSETKAVAKAPDDFVSVARRLGADEDKERFEAKLKKLANAKPEKSK